MSVTYNAENRPVRWERGSTVVTMDFDRMGRRVFYREEVNGEVTKHHRFVYDNYLCVQKLDSLNNNSQINLFVWDPTESVATRPLFMLANPGNYKLFYTFDGNKNVSELVHFESRNGIAAHYDYAPFGTVTRVVNASAISVRNFHLENPFRFSSEYHDDTLGLVYYNYRHYNPIDGRWCGRDPKIDEYYLFCDNNSTNKFDFRGLMASVCLDENCKSIAKEGFPNEPKFNALLEILRNRKCAIPRIRCDICTESDTKYGEYTSNNTIRLCSRLGRKKSDYQTTLLHELSHAKDSCLSSTPFSCYSKDGLKALACSEVRAYRYANLILDEEKLKTAVLGSLDSACSNLDIQKSTDLFVVVHFAVENCSNLSPDAMLAKW